MEVNRDKTVMTDNHQIKGGGAFSACIKDVDLTDTDNPPSGVIIHPFDKPKFVMNRVLESCRQKLDIIKPDASKTAVFGHVSAGTEFTCSGLLCNHLSNPEPVVYKSEFTLADLEEILSVMKEQHIGGTAGAQLIEFNDNNGELESFGEACKEYAKSIGSPLKPLLSELPIEKLIIEQVLTIAKSGPELRRERRKKLKKK